jgi:hypothetical protein
MPRTRPLGPPPDERPNWASLNEGQRRYAWEQYNLAKVRRGISIDHPIPDLQDPEPSQPNQEEQNYINDFDLSLLDNNTPQETQEESLEEILNFPVDSTDHQNIINELNNMSDGQSNQVASTSGTGQGGKAPKRAAPSKSSGASLPGSAGGIGGGGMEQAVEPIPRPMYSAHSYTRYFKKVHRLMSFGLAFKPVAVAKSSGTNAYSDVFMVTPMAHIPWEHLFMYVNPSEFALLPPGARVRHVSCSVKAENIRIAFPTNSSDSNLATLNQNKFLRIGKALNQKYQGVNAQPGGFAAAQPMIATTVTEFPGVTSAYKNWVDNFYGVENSDATAPDIFTTNTPRHQFGVPWVCQYYFMPVTQTNDPTKSGWEDLQVHLEEIKVDGPAGQIVRMEYTPEVGIIKQPVKSIWTGLPSTSTPGTTRNIAINTGAGNSQARRTQIGVTNSRPDEVTSLQTNWTEPDITFDMVQFIEKSQNLYQGITPAYNASTQPTLHVGVMPVPALTTSAIDNTTNNNSFTDAQAYFEVTCEAAIECAYPTKRPLATVPNVSMGADIFQTGAAASLNYKQTMAYGMFQS